MKGPIVFSRCPQVKSNSCSSVLLDLQTETLFPIFPYIVCSGALIQDEHIRPLNGREM